MPRISRTLLVTLLAITASTTLAQQSSHTGGMHDSKPMMSITEPSPVRNISEYSLQEKKDNLAIKGYDPVAYFKEGGSTPTKGKKSISIRYKDVTYYFASEEHKKLFQSNPAKYEPAYGGWCAWAMSDGGGKTEINPKTFIVRDNRLYLFYNGFLGNTKKMWEEHDHNELSNEADTQWKRVSGESPRVAPTKP